MAAYFKRQPAASLSPGEWHAHYHNLYQLSILLRRVKTIDEASENGWSAIDRIDKELRLFFSANPYYGPLSRQVVDRISADSKTFAHASTPSAES
jgi:hypothetical protein